MQIMTTRWTTTQYAFTVYPTLNPACTRRMYWHTSWRISSKLSLPSPSMDTFHFLAQIKCKHTLVLLVVLVSWLFFVRGSVNWLLFKRQPGIYLFCERDGLPARDRGNGTVLFQHFLSSLPVCRRCSAASFSACESTSLLTLLLPQPLCTEKNHHITPPPPIII